MIRPKKDYLDHSNLGHDYENKVSDTRASKIIQCCNISKCINNLVIFKEGYKNKASFEN